jgi:hypothetical protein
MQIEKDERPINQQSFVQKIAQSTVSDREDREPSQHSIWWWIFFCPGKVILWIQYMFPSQVSDAFGSAPTECAPSAIALYSGRLLHSVYVALRHTPLAQIMREESPWQKRPA